MGLIHPPSYWKLDRKTGRFVKIIPLPETLEGKKCPIRNKKKNFKRKGKRYTKKAHRAKNDML